MNTEFQPNGYIEALIKQYGPTAKEVIKAIEFWGLDAGEFVVDGKVGQVNLNRPSSSTKVPDKG